MKLNVEEMVLYLYRKMSQVEDNICGVKKKYFIKKKKKKERKDFYIKLFVKYLFIYSDFADSI